MLVRFITIKLKNLQMGIDKHYLALIMMFLCSCSNETTELGSLYKEPVTSLTFKIMDSKYPTELALDFEDMTFTLYHSDTLYFDDKIPENLESKILPLISNLKTNQLDRIFDINISHGLDQELKFYGKDLSYVHMIKSFGKKNTPKEVSELFDQLKKLQSELGKQKFVE